MRLTAGARRPTRWRSGSKRSLRLASCSSRHRRRRAVTLSGLGSTRGPSLHPRSRSSDSSTMVPAGLTDQAGGSGNLILNTSPSTTSTSRLTLCWHSRSSPSVPAHRFDVVLRHAFAGVVTEPEEELRASEPLLRRKPVPAHRFGVVHQPEVDLRTGCAPAQPAHAARRSPASAPATAHRTRAPQGWRRG